MLDDGLLEVRVKGRTPRKGGEALDHHGLCSEHVEAGLKALFACRFNPVE